MQRAAIFSECGAYRYVLTRTWSDGERHALFVMLNPSTANETVDDATIRRCIGYAKREACGGLVVVNLFAYRATLPSDMIDVSDPIGPHNDTMLRAALRSAAERGEPIIAGWGACGLWKDRDAAVMRIAADAGATLLCFAKTKAGAPVHPLYQRADAPLIPLANGIANADGRK